MLRPTLYGLIGQGNGLFPSSSQQQQRSVHEPHTIALQPLWQSSCWTYRHRHPPARSLVRSLARSLRRCLSTPAATLTALQRRATDTRPIFFLCLKRRLSLLSFLFFCFFVCFSSPPSPLPPLPLLLVSERRIDREAGAATFPCAFPPLPPEHVVDQHKDGLFCKGHFGPA